MKEKEGFVEGNGEIKDELGQEITKLESMRPELVVKNEEIKMEPLKNEIKKENDRW